MIHNIKLIWFRMKSHPGLKRYSANFSLMLVEQFFRMAVAFLIPIWLASKLGPKDFGIYSYVIAIVSIISVVPKLGFDNVLVKHLISDQANKLKILGAAFYCKLAASFLLFMLVLFFSDYFVSNKYVSELLVICSAGLLLQSLDVVDSYFLSIGDIKKICFYKIIQITISLILKIYLIFIHASLKWFIVALLLDQIIIGITYFIAIKKYNIIKLSYKTNITIVKSLLKSSWPLLVASISSVIYLKIDQLMIKNILGFEELGFYSSVVNISAIFNIIGGVLISSLLPVVINAKNVDNKHYHYRLQQICFVLTWISLFFIVFVSFNSVALINLFYGNSYEHVKTTLTIHIFGVFFSYFGISSGLYLISEGKTRQSMYRTLLGAIVSVVLNIILIPIYGINGAAFSSVVSQFVANILFDLFDMQLRAMMIKKIQLLFDIKGYKRVFT